MMEREGCTIESWISWAAFVMGTTKIAASRVWEVSVNGIDMVEVEIPQSVLCVPVSCSI